MRKIMMAIALSGLLPCTQAHANQSNDILLQLTEQVAAASLSPVIGRGCVGVHSFLQGLDRLDAAYWNVMCANGKSYQVAIDADATGKAKIMDCDFLKQILNMPCFKTFKSMQEEQDRQGKPK
jgi:hypothetical protein